MVLVPTAFMMNWMPHSGTRHFIWQTITGKEALTTLEHELTDPNLGQKRGGRHDEQVEEEVNV